MSMGVSISGDIFSSFLSFLGIDLSMSYEESESAENTTSWSVDYTLGPTPGTTGYPSFQPKLKCKLVCLHYFRRHSRIRRSFNGPGLIAYRCSWKFRWQLRRH